MAFSSDLKADIKQRKLNLEPLYTFFMEDITPKNFAKLLDGFIYEYISPLICSQKAKKEDIHEHTYEFFFYLKLLWDILEKTVKLTP